MRYTRWALAALWALSLVFHAGAQARTIQVFPGHNTLAAVAEEVANGDTLVLVDGLYTNEGNVYLPAVSLRSIDATVTPRVVASRILLGRSLTGQGIAAGASPVAIQGLTFVNTQLELSLSRPVPAQGGDTATVLLQANTFRNSLVDAYQSYGTTAAVGNEWLFDDFSVPIASTTLSTFPAYGEVRSPNGTLVFAANTVQVAAPEQVIFGDVMSISGGEITVVAGNRFDITAAGFSGSVPRQGREPAVIKLQSAAAVVGNRFEAQFAGPHASNTGPGALVALDYFSPGAGSQLRNNVFNVAFGTIAQTNSSEFDAAVLRLGDRRNGASAVRSIEIVNNTINASGDAYGANNALIRVTASGDTNWVGEIANNVLVAATGTVLADTPNSGVLELRHNLCFGASLDSSACAPAQGNLLVAPAFAELTDFTLDPLSPAIDAGLPATRFNDVADGTRNDLGVHGGPWGFEQYDQQRAPSNKPFLFPLFGPDMSLVRSTEAALRVLSVPRFR